MPTYEFRCPDGTIVEKIFKISEAPDEIPSPNGDGMAKRIISGGAALVFKGSGFYITDYGKDGKKDQRAATDKSSAAVSSAASEKSGAAKSDSAAAPSKSSESKAPASAPSSGSTSSPSKD
jgi:predicted nucleic acid-binding Zn ribbon protein